MNNNKRQAGTNAQQSTNDELLPSAPLAANPMLAAVHQEEIKVKIQNNNPKKKDVKTYEIATVQDMADCVTSENIEGFLQDLEMCLRSHILVKALTNAQISEGKLPPDFKILFPSFKWIDDWKPTNKLTGTQWIDAKKETPKLIKDEDYSENVLAVCNGQLSVMCYCYISGEDGGYVWANCNEKIDGDAEFDDNYEVTHWQSFPSLPKLGTVSV